MELILVRHALPVREEKAEGVADPGLSDVGHDQSRRMAEWLTHGHGDEPIDRILVSPKRRARETAAPLETLLGVDAEVIEEFSEIDRASTSYIPVEDMIAEQHPMLTAMREQRWEELGYTDPDVFRKEVFGATERIIEQFDGQRLVIVAHGGTVNAIVTGLMDIEAVFMFDAGYTSISRMRRNEFSHTLRIHSLNEMAHLTTSRG